jgi:hypothetical protein
MRLTSTSLLAATCAPGDFHPLYYGAAVDAAAGSRNPHRAQCLGCDYERDLDSGVEHSPTLGVVVMPAQAISATLRSHARRRFVRRGRGSSESPVVVRGSAALRSLRSPRAGSARQTARTTPGSAPSGAVATGTTSRPTFWVPGARTRRRTRSRGPRSTP